MTDKPKAECTSSDTWNCKYCKKTQTCDALNDDRNFGGTVKPEPEGEPDTVAKVNSLRVNVELLCNKLGTARIAIADAEANLKLLRDVLSASADDPFDPLAEVLLRNKDVAAELLKTGDDSATEGNELPGMWDLSDLIGGETEAIGKPLKSSPDPAWEVVNQIKRLVPDIKSGWHTFTLTFQLNDFLLPTSYEDLKVMSFGDKLPDSTKPDTN